MAVDKEKAKKTFEQWNRGARIRNIAHQRAGAFYSSWGKRVGVLVTVFTVIVGTSFFSRVSVSNDQTIFIVVGFISVAAAVLSGVNSFLNFPELGAKHTETGLKFGELRRRMDVINSLVCDDPKTEAHLTEIGDAFNAALKGAPILAPRFYDAAEKKLASEWQKASQEQK
jgi:hypothetical protein